MAFDFISAQLAERKSQHLYRQTTAVQCQGRLIQYQQASLLNFSGNDYLSLAQAPELVTAWQQGLAQYGCGSGASALVTGYSDAHYALEQTIKEWLNVPAVALFNSGYSANQAVLKLLLGKQDLLIQDKLNHASLIEAGQYVAANMVRFRHNDMSHLEQRLSQGGENKLVISEGVFSMDGDQAPLAEIVRLTRQYQAWLMVDDAHGIGVLGPHGQGSLAQQGIHPQDCHIHMATFGKALGVAGAMVAGTVDLVDYITNFSKPYIYTTAMPPAQAVAIKASIELLQQQPWRQQKLLQNIATFKQAAQQEGIEIAPSETAIQPVIIGGNNATLALAQRLREQGFYCTAIRPPTVPPGSARLRVTLCSAHTTADIHALVTALAQGLAGNADAGMTNREFSNEQ
ncbi:8-amino-7-oxononanoate synthase [Motilimonas pumila]|uniref:8-amino-7-oxononanoate synthase n=1 Tax=Motilimonas pumila TaxID=2303987 RepID=A0A418YFY8_9GAMM|nr:8-amino-7-oxononanoate synthase [Motilimonas pumila]RJG48455.1 8-amino-7-oxononanoate synthase [Motilimonas pumila]